MRFAFATDFHVTDQLGRYRANCLDDILAKVRFVVETAAARNCDVIVVGGDWFNSPKLGYTTQAALLDVIDEFPMWVGVLGQHDIHGHDPATARQSPVGALLRAQNVAILNGMTVMVGGQKILGFSFTEDVVAAAKAYAANTPQQASLVIYHALITPENPGQFLVDPRGLPPLGKLAVCGDYHAGFLITGINGVLYANPGALTRTTPADAQRAPKLLLGKLDDDEARFTDEIAVPFRPAAEVFDLELWLEDNAHRAEIEQRTSLFAQAVQSLGVTSQDVMDDIVRALGRERRHAVVNRALTYLHTAEATNGG